MKPLEELKCFFSTRKVKQINVFRPTFNYSDYYTSSSKLLENNSIISIIIPTLNRYEVLKKLLKDLESQNYKNFETIIIDQSDNYNPEFYKKYNLNINLIHQSEKALWKARNRGIIEAKSDLLIFLDDD